MMVRHVTQLLVNVVLVDYILPEFCHCLIFFVQKNWCWFLLTNTKYYRANFFYPFAFFVQKALFIHHK